jgi:probable rRNA maturation factor
MIFLDKIDNLTLDVPGTLVENAALLALRHQSVDVDLVDLTIVLSDDTQLQQLNLEWMEVDAPTDVLSFPSDEADPDTGHRYIGDILISVERANEQASKAGHALSAEVQLLAVHGILHLLGHDHAEPEEKNRMWQAQAEILGQLGLGDLEIRE